MTATCSGSSRSPKASMARLATSMTSISARPQRAGDEVDVLALAQPEGLEQLSTGAGLLDGVGGERVADGVADALGSSVAIPAVALTSPAGGGPASVTPRCSGWSVTSASCR
jgi:hypothetical protein